MKKVEVKLSLAVVAPLLDVIKAAADTMTDELAVRPPMDRMDADLRGVWRDDLLEAQNQDVGVLLALFDRDFFSSGVVSFDAENADAVVRACSSVRLRLRDRFLKNVADETLESGDVELEALPEPERKAFMCYLFLATVQELIIQHLDSTILDG
jgi:hypothetical protein